MERLLLEAHTVQNLSLKGRSSVGGAGEGDGAGFVTGAANEGATSTLPSRNEEVVGAGCMGGSSGIGV